MSGNLNDDEYIAVTDVAAALPIAFLLPLLLHPSWGFPPAMPSARSSLPEVFRQLSLARAPAYLGPLSTRPLPTLHPCLEVFAPAIPGGRSMGFWYSKLHACLEV